MGLAKIFQDAGLVPSAPPRRPKKKAKQADGTSTQAPVQRAKPKEAARVSTPGAWRIRPRFIEAAGGLDPAGRRFRCILIQEGLGNLGDRFYYTRQCLEGCAGIFEGKKIYADHPAMDEEQTRPERSVRDILGYFENVSFEEGSEGQGQLAGDVCILPGEAFNWASQLMLAAVAFQKGHPEQDLVGLSINASGDANEMSVEEFKSQYQVPASAIGKLDAAAGIGIETIRVCTAIVEAVSCDLVTEAGAGGKLLTILEREASAMGKTAGKNGKGKVRESESHEDDGEHDDAEKDKELIKKELQKHMGGGDEENTESGEADMTAAMEAYEALQAEGVKGEEAYKCAAAMVKAGKKMAQAKKEAEGESESEAEETEEAQAPPFGKGKKESSGANTVESQLAEKDAEILKLSGRIHALESKGKKSELETYLDQKLGESKLPNDATKKIRALIKDPKNKEQIDHAIGLFLEGRKAAIAEGDSGFTFGTEKEQHHREAEGDSVGEGFGDCTESD